MSNPQSVEVAIVDYGLGNLFSVKHACEDAGLAVRITSNGAEILRASAVILPGVGAFGDAMETLARLDLVSVLRDVMASGKPMLGICLGLQLLMREGHEFGLHRGLGIIDGEVVRLDESHHGTRRLKVPHVGWNAIRLPSGRSADAWEESLLNGVPDGTFMYFVHSYYPRPSDPDVVLSTTTYGGGEFCSGLQRDNVFGCQFHPERSGWSGLRVYRNLATSLKARVAELGVRKAGS